jgi:hypothetical protein
MTHPMRGESKRCVMVAGSRSLSALLLGGDDAARSADPDEACLHATVLKAY